MDFYCGDAHKSFPFLLDEAEKFLCIPSQIPSSEIMVTVVM